MRDLILEKSCILESYKFEMHFHYVNISLCVLLMKFILVGEKQFFLEKFMK